MIRRHNILMKFSFAAAVFSAAFTLAAADAGAQGEAVSIAVRPLVGVNVPFGAQRDAAGNSRILGLQAALGVTPTLGIVAGASWAFAEHRFAATDDRLDMLQYNVGLELGRSIGLGNYWLLRPFAVAGAGLRSYMYEDASLDNQSCLEGYGGGGLELVLDRIRLRTEVRGHVFCYKAPVNAGTSETRGDANILFALAYHFR
jgi:hypothetical protein